MRLFQSQLGVECLHWKMVLQQSILLKIAEQSVLCILQRANRQRTRLLQNESRQQFSGSCPTRLSSREWKSMIAPCSQEPLGMFWEDQQFDIAKGACWLRCCVESRRL